MRWLTADWSGNKGHIFSGVLKGLSGLGHTYKTISRSDVDQRCHLIEAIQSGEFDALLTWQRFYRMQARTIMKRGFLWVARK